MCGIIAGKLFDNDYVEEYVDTIRKLFVQSQIRGRHSSGLSYYDNNDLITIMKKGSAKKFVKDDLYNEAIKAIKDFSIFIGHVRYSTSNLLYNQPIQINSEFSIVHNGVITQREFDHWKKDFDFLLKDKKLKTENDTELLAISFYSLLKEEKNDPLKIFNKSSISCSSLYKKRIYFFRNGKRPLYYFMNNKYFFLSSTKDILIRSGLKEKFIMNVKPFIYYYINKYNKIKSFEFQYERKRDWQ